MECVPSNLVHIARDFLLAHRTLRDVACRQRSGELGFDEVRGLVGDSEEAVLFRLKERSHALFRDDTAPGTSDIAPGLLFDLAVGSLFHESMKLRENFYQRAFYGPKVRALKAASVRDTTGLLHEFEKILQGSLLRLDESLQEAETLLGQTTAQFRLLLVAHAECGVVTRYLIENTSQVEEVLGTELDQLLAEVHGRSGLGYARAARSYLESGFFAEARGAAERAASRGEAREEMRALMGYAEGMQAYLEGRFADCLRALRKWLGVHRPEETPSLRLALSVVSRVGQLVEGEGEARVASDASDLAEQLREHLAASSV